MADNSAYYGYDYQWLETRSQAVDKAGPIGSLLWGPVRGLGGNEKPTGNDFYSGDVRMGKGTPGPDSAEAENLRIEMIYNQIMGEQPGTAEARAAEFRNVATMLGHVQAQLRNQTDQIHVEWEAEAQKAFLIKVGETLAYLEVWESAVIRAASALEGLAKVMREAQEEMRDVWDRFQNGQEVARDPFIANLSTGATGMEPPPVGLRTKLARDLIEPEARELLSRMANNYAPYLTELKLARALRLEPLNAVANSGIPRPSMSGLSGVPGMGAPTSVPATPPPAPPAMGMTPPMPPRVPTPNPPDVPNGLGADVPRPSGLPELPSEPPAMSPPAVPALPNANAASPPAVPGMWGAALGRAAPAVPSSAARGGEALSSASPPRNLNVPGAARTITPSGAATPAGTTPTSGLPGGMPPGAGAPPPPSNTASPPRRQGKVLDGRNPTGSGAPSMPETRGTRPPLAQGASGPGGSPSPNGLAHPSDPRGDQSTGTEVAAAFLPADGAPAVLGMHQKVARPGGTAEAPSTAHSSPGAVPSLLSNPHRGNHQAKTYTERRAQRQADREQRNRQQRLPISEFASGSPMSIAPVLRGRAESQVDARAEQDAQIPRVLRYTQAATREEHLPARADRTTRNTQQDNNSQGTDQSTWEVRTPGGPVVANEPDERYRVEPGVAVKPRKAENKKESF